VTTSTALAAHLQVAEPQLRLPAAEGRAALRSVLGRPAAEARARLRHGPGRTCEPLARLLDRALARAECAGLDPAHLVVADGHVEEAEDIVRVRRKAHGKADWIHSPTSRVELTLQPAGLFGTARIPAATGPPMTASAPSRPPTQSPADARTTAVREALFDVIDPDLGVNVVDLGFVRDLRIEGRTAVITMTLTSAACPLTGVLEDQIRTGLTILDEVDDHRVDWVWSPAWRPADMTDSGREQLRAIGFTI
jgi:metal-sulfur cluster biosynthetic enzyme/ribosomal protein L22